jgi:hypothetical protein
MGCFRDLILYDVFLAIYAAASYNWRAKSLVRHGQAFQAVQNNISYILPSLVAGRTWW